jgi:hypothetical protein
VHMTLQLMLVFGVIVLGALGFGCAARTYASVETEETLTMDEAPTLVAVEPGVWVVRRYPSSIYMVDGQYWTCHGDTWYRSTTWDGAWLRVGVEIVPRTIARRDHAHYVYYEGNPGAPIRSLPPGHRETPGLRRGQGKEKEITYPPNTNFATSFPPNAHRKDERRKSHTDRYAPREDAWQTHGHRR